MTQWWWKRYCCHNNKATPVMKTDLHCSTLHQVCPHCAPIRTSSHYSSLNQWVWRWKKSWKVPSLSSLHPKKQKSISSIGPCPMTGCLASFWCSAHTHTHTILWHLFSSLLLALHCPCHMANGKDLVCVFVRVQMRVCEETVGSEGGYWRLTRWQRLPTPSEISMNTWGQARLNGRAEAVEKSSPEGGGMVGGTNRRGAAVWMMGALARWMLGGD